MEKMNKVVAWICIASLPLAGCYSSTAIRAADSTADNMRTEHIAYVITKDLTKYEFNYSAPEVLNDHIVGIAVFLEGNNRTTRQVQLPFSNVFEVGVKEFEPVKTGIAVVGIPLAIYGVCYAIAMAMFAAQGGIHFH